jgi:glycogen debranching enzyme
VRLTVLDGSTFCRSDEQGDIAAAADGLFAADTRFLSRLVLTIGGERPLLLTGRAIAPAEASFVLRNPPLPNLGPDTLAILRHRTVARGLREEIEVRNLTGRGVEVTLELELACDFADIFTVKQHDFGVDGQGSSAPLPAPAVPEVRDGGRELRFVDPDQSGAELQIVFSEPPAAGASRIAYALELGPRERWHLELQVLTSADGELRPAAEAAAILEAGRRAAAESLRGWTASVPTLSASWVELDRSYRQAVRDIAALRMSFGGAGELIAAGMPWFMTVFGRDTLIASLQTLPLGSGLSRAGLLALAELQADGDDPAVDAEPGKIVHEIRRGKAALRWFGRYYGTVDATPLFLVLLSEHWRWTRDDALVEQLRPHALRALEWIDVHGDADGDGFVEYERRSPHGIENQSWKDSHDSQLFHDGSHAHGAIAAVEVQGYVYDAKLRLAELARVVWREPQLAARLETEAALLQERFDTAFWCERGGEHTYALALDGEKRPVNSLTSNIGHLLWSGIVPDERLDVLVAQLAGDALWSGWGVRTMAADDAGYNPLAYHDGTVWPHDNSLIAWGLARCGRHGDALRIVRAMLEAASYFDYQLPEVFAGFARSEIAHPIVYPTASRPQAWAAGTVVLLLRLLLGLEPDPIGRRLVSTAPAPLPDWLGALRFERVPALGTTWSVALEDGAVRVSEND